MLCVLSSIFEDFYTMNRPVGVLICFVITGVITSSVAQQINAENFKKMYIQGRMKQTAVISKLSQYEDKNQQYQMLLKLSNSMFPILSASLKLLNNANYSPENDFPTEVSVQEALKNMLDHTAFFTDVVNLIPQGARQLFKKRSDWYHLLVQCTLFSVSSNLIDKHTKSLMKDALEIFPLLVSDDPDMNLDPTKSKKGKTRKKMVKGPRWSSGSSFGEL